MMSWRREATFEVMVEQDGRSSIDRVFDEERPALERAQYLLRLAKFPVVRVLRITRAGKEETIFEKAVAGGAKPTTISAIDGANLCADVLQVFSFESRMTLLRLLRAYFDEEQVIPSEQLHRYSALRAFEREALLFGPALNRLAALQAPMLGMQPDERHGQLERLFHGLKDLAQHAASLAGCDAALARGGVAGLLAATAEHPPEERDRIVTHAVAALLEPHRDWRPKVAALLRLREDGNGESVRLVDEFLAETVDGREPVRALIGYAPDLASALHALVETERGALDDRLPHTAELLALSEAIGAVESGAGGFIHVREALLRRVRGGLDGLTPLTHEGGPAEAAALQALADRLAVFEGYRGGPAMAAALTRRAKLAFGSGGLDLPFEDAVQRLIGRLRGPAARIGYLIDLASSGLGQGRAAVLRRLLAEEFDHVRSAAELAPPGVSLPELRKVLGGRLRDAGVPPPLVTRLIARIDAVPEAERARLARARAETLDLAKAGPAALGLTLSHAGRRHRLSGEGAELVLGRSPDCDVQLDVAAASRRHATLSVRDGQFVLTDSSRNGTSVVLPGAGTRRLHSGDALVLPALGEILIGTADQEHPPARLVWTIKPLR